MKNPVLRKEARIKIQLLPLFQYPMKNQYKNNRLCFTIASFYHHKWLLISIKENYERIRECEIEVTLTTIIETNAGRHFSGIGL